jgi:hypothetical protein
MTPRPDPGPVPVLALSAAHLLSNSNTTVKAVSRGTLQGTGTGSTDPRLSNSEAGTDLDTAATVSSPTLPAATALLEVVPDPSPAGEPPALVATESNPTGAGTTRGTAAASATEACREAGTGRGGESLPDDQLSAGTVNNNSI